MSELLADVELPWANCDWVVFDAVGTLICPTPSVAVAYHTVASRYGSRLGVEEIGERFREAFRQSEQAIPDEPASGSRWTGSRWTSSDAIEVARWCWIVSEVVTDISETERCFTELWEHFAKASSWSCFDDVEPTLTALRQSGYRIAVASNFDSRLHAVCDGHSPLSLIERRIVSSETGFRKPAPEFYTKIASKCGCAGNKILMVGDDAEHDVAGPIAAGMQALLLDRRTPSRAGTSIGSLRQLMPEDEVGLRHRRFS